MRQSGTVVLALVLVWLLVLAEGRGREGSHAPEGVASCQLEVQAVAGSRAPAAARGGSEASVAPSAADTAGDHALRRGLRGVQLLV